MEQMSMCNVKTFVVINSQRVITDSKVPFTYMERFKHLLAHYFSFRASNVTVLVCSRCSNERSFQHAPIFRDKLLMNSRYTTCCAVDRRH